MSLATRSVALAGIGGIGSHILRSFLNTVHRSNLIILTRAESKREHLSNNLPSTVPMFSTDYSDVTTLTMLFQAHAIDVVASAISESALQAQYTLADAAKVSGSVKLFVPSEWGILTEGTKRRETSNPHSIKDEFVGEPFSYKLSKKLVDNIYELTEYLKSIDLPYTRFYVSKPGAPRYKFTNIIHLDGIWV